MKIKSALMGAAAGVAMMTGATQVMADAHEITVAYFLEWPMPFQHAKVMGEYEEAMGVAINWVSFDTGTAMSAAMASGDVQLSVSQGIPPFVVAASAGQDIQVIDVAVSYAENDNCVVSSVLEIDKTSAAELAGKKVAVPLGTAAHYGFLKQMDHFGVDIASMEVVDMAPADGAAAIAQSQVDMACGWGGALRRMKAPASFVAENAELVATFLAVTAKANAAWNDGSMTAEMLPVIAKDAGMDEDATAETMAGFVFPSVADQLSDAWMGANAATFMKGVAEVFVDAGSIPSANDSYEGNVNTAPLMDVSSM